MRNGGVATSIALGSCFDSLGSRCKASARIRIQSRFLIALRRRFAPPRLSHRMQTVVIYASFTWETLDDALATFNVRFKLLTSAMQVWLLASCFWLLRAYRTLGILSRQFCGLSRDTSKRRLSVAVVGRRQRPRRTSHTSRQEHPWFLKSTDDQNSLTSPMTVTARCWISHVSNLRPALATSITAAAALSTDAVDMTGSSASSVVTMMALNVP